MKVVAVTGGSGFIGGEVAMELSKDPQVEEIRILDIAFPDYQMNPKMKYHRVDVGDLASLLKYTQNCDTLMDNVGLLGTNDRLELGDYPGVTIDTNIKGFHNQLVACRLNNVKRVFHQTKPMFSHSYENTYTYTKKCAELIAFHARECHKQQITVCTYFNASGHRQHLGHVRKLFPLAVVNAILDFDFTVFGSGAQLMDIVHVNDLARAAIMATRIDSMDKPIRIFDIGSGIPVSVMDFLTKTKEIVGSSSKFQYLPMRKGEKEDTQIRAEPEDIKTLKALGWECKYGLEETIKDYVDYYLSGKIDPVYIFNCLKYFQDTDSKFSIDGKIVDISDLGLDYINSKFLEKM